MNDPQCPVHIRFEAKPLSGLLFIGDPHVEGRTPGFRRDNYPETILQKLQWTMDYAKQHQLQPILLGDVFDKPRDNPNWILSRLLDVFATECVPTIFGNHDCANPQLDENDSLMLMAKAGAVHLLDANHLWACKIENRIVMLGGSPYRHPIPDSFSLQDRHIEVFEATSGAEIIANPMIDERNAVVANNRMVPSLTIWLTHHDLTFPNADEAVVTNLSEIPGIHYVVNGHIHRRASADVSRGQTTWINPGNIARRSRADSIRGHLPAVLRLDITREGQWFHYVNVPHQSPEEVFYDLDSIDSAKQESEQSSFVTGLAMLQSRKTESGAGLIQFLKENVGQFDQDVAAEIMKLADEVLTQNNHETAV
ncbi:MAG: metallophosphoesterase [Pirellula sp.]